MSLTKRLIKNSIANIWSKLSTVIFRLIQVPILLSALGKEDYGRWLVLYSIPSWIILANLGFGSVASNEISINYAGGNKEKSQLIYNLTYRLLAFISLIIISIIVAISPYIDWSVLLKINTNRNFEIATAVIFLTSATMLSSFTELFYAKIKSAQKSFVIPILGSVRPWIDLVIMFITLHLSKRFDYLSFAVFCSTCIYVISINIISSKYMSTIYIKKIDYKFTDFKYILKKGAAFQAFPLGNALLYQGNLLVIQIILGPESVALFGTVRTLVRSINQILESINQIIWPEINTLFGENNVLKIGQLHRLSILVSIITALFFAFLIYETGLTIFELWIDNKLNLSNKLLAVFLIPIPFNALWVTSSVIHMASNKHEGLALRYLIAMILAVISCGLLSYVYGVEGAAISTIVSDIVLIPYVFKSSLKILGESKIDFFEKFKKEIFIYISNNYVYRQTRKY